MRGETAEIRETRVGECYSYRQYCSLGPLPPRTPARPDPQVPRDPKLGPCVHGKIGAFYFYEKGSNDDPAFGFIDIELSVQSISAGKVRIELYCVADGYQTSRGVGANHPVRLAIMANGNTVGSVAWPFADVICGHADPMNFFTDIGIGDTSFSLIDRIDLLDVDGLSAPCE
jgi:hypothetical protein